MVQNKRHIDWYSLKLIVVTLFFDIIFASVSLLVRSFFLFLHYKHTTGRIGAAHFWKNKQFYKYIIIILFNDSGGWLHIRLWPYINRDIYPLNELLISSTFPMHIIYLVFYDQFIWIANDLTYICLTNLFVPTMY